MRNGGFRSFNRPRRSGSSAEPDLAAEEDNAPLTSELGQRQPLVEQRTKQNVSMQRILRRRIRIAEATTGQDALASVVRWN